MFKPALLVLLTLLSVETKAQETYDFENLTTGDISGQDNWKVTVSGGAVTGHADVVDASDFGDYSGSKALQMWPPGSSHIWVSRVNDGNWSLPDMNGVETIVLQFDLFLNYWGNQFSLGYDANDDGHIASSETTFSLYSYMYQSKLTLQGPAGNAISTYSSFPATGHWIRARLIVDTQSNNGSGSISFSFRDIGEQGSWQYPPEMQNVNAGFTPGSGDHKDPVNINGMVYDQEAGDSGRLDNIKVWTDPMMLTYNTALSAGNDIVLPLYGSVNAIVDWGDGTADTYTSTGNKSHIYSQDDTYIVIIDGTLTQFGNLSGVDGIEKLVKVSAFGDLGLQSLEGAFRNANNLAEVPEELPSTVTNLSFCFRGADEQTTITNLEKWDVSNVKNMQSMFMYASAFNQDIGDWNTGSVTNMGSMFDGSSEFNQDIGQWNVSSVTDMSYMFQSAGKFNQDLKNWNVSNVTDMTQMFSFASAFNQNLANWNISKVESLFNMFSYTSLSSVNYDAIINGWATQQVQNNVVLGAAAIQYTPEAEAARQGLIDNYEWSFLDGGLAQVFSGGSGTEEAPYLIANLSDLQYLAERSFYWDKHFVQTANIDASATQYWDDSDDNNDGIRYNDPEDQSSDGNNEGFSPIGNLSLEFTGSYSGQYNANDYKLQNLIINRSNDGYVGLLGRASNALLRNITLEGVNITGQYYVGGLAGSLHNSTEVENCSTSGTVQGEAAGGLVGQVNESTVQNSSSSASIVAIGTSGGLAGLAMESSFSNCWATGNIEVETSNGTNVGGLIGQIISKMPDTSSEIIACFASGNVTAEGSYNVGGLIGQSYNIPIRSSKSSGDVTGMKWVGGLVGYMGYSSLDDSYALGNVAGDENVGGLAGQLEQATLINSYSVNTVTMNNGSNEGGLAGLASNSTITSTYFDKTVNTGMPDEADYGKTTAEMTNYTTFQDGGWDFELESDNGTDDEWGINNNENSGYPFLSWEDFTTCFNPSDGGTIAGAQNICYNGQPVLLSNGSAASGYLGTLEYKWQQSTTSSSEGFQDIANTNSLTYSPGALTDTTWFRRLARVGCQTNWDGAAASNVIQIAVYDEFTSGAIATTGETICYGGDPAEIASVTAASGGDETITYAWYKSTDDFSADSALVQGATGAGYHPPSGLTVTTSYRRYAKDGSCNTPFGVSAGTWKITVRNEFTPGAIATTGETIFYEGDPSPVGNLTEASGGDENITYAWYRSTNDFADSTLIQGVTSSVYDPPSGLTQSTSYRRYAKDATCNSSLLASQGTWKVEIAGLWTGAENSNWHNANNWEDGQVPDRSIDVTLIQSAYGNDPVIDSPAICRSLVIKANAALTISNNQSIVVFGNLVLGENAGFSNDGTIQFSGGDSRIIDNRKLKSTLKNVEVTFLSSP